MCTNYWRAGLVTAPASLYTTVYTCIPIPPAYLHHLPCTYTIQGDLELTVVRDMKVMVAMVRPESPTDRQTDA